MQCLTAAQKSTANQTACHVREQNRKLTKRTNLKDENRK